MFFELFGIPNFRISRSPEIWAGPGLGRPGPGLGLAGPAQQPRHHATHSALMFFKAWYAAFESCADSREGPCDENCLCMDCGLKAILHTTPPREDSSQGCYLHSFANTINMTYLKHQNILSLFVPWTTKDFKKFQIAPYQMGPCRHFG